jgi:ABC-type transport system involved in multi-copper enzyme maturation permease subunit
MKADLFRILKGKAIYVMIVVLFMSLLMSSYTLLPLNVGINVDSVDYNAIGEINSISDMRQYMMENMDVNLDQLIMGKSSYLYYFFIAIVIIVVCSDFSHGTVKNVISTSISRRKYYLSKLLLSLGLGTILILINTYGMYFLNIIINNAKFTSGIDSISLIMVRQLPMLYGIISVLVCIAFLVKRTALFNGISIPMIMGIQLALYLIITLFSLDAAKVLNFEFETIIYNLSDSTLFTNSYILKSTLLGFTYLLLSSIIGIFHFKRCEIK